MIEKLKNTYEILNRLDNQDSKKFVSNDFKDLNQELELNLKDYLTFNIKDNNYNPSDEENEMISNIIHKIEQLENKVLPKATLINSFSDSLI